MKQLIFPSGLELLQFPILARHSAQINHYISTRHGGVSYDALGGLNLSFKVGDHEEHVEQNRQALADVLKISDDKLVFPVQTHSANVGLVTHTTTEIFENTDALITNEKGICISVMSADCVPLLFFDPVNKAVGAAHAGWRGTVQKIAVQTLAEMTKYFGTNPSDTIVGIGPSISAKVYEVGTEVIEAVQEVLSDTSGVLYRKDSGKAMLDLWELNKKLLIKAEVKPENIEVSGLCTFKHHEDFFSARHSGNKAGRFAAGIMLM